MNNKETKFVKALIKGTEKGEITWNEVNRSDYTEIVNDEEEHIDTAFYHTDLGRNIIILKSKVYLKNDKDENIEKSNVHIVFTKNFEFKEEFRISDFELENKSILWTLLKLVQRRERKTEDFMNTFINRYLK